jgi:hypothetical protein
MENLVMYTASQVLQILIKLDKYHQDEEGTALLNTECLETPWDGNCHSLDEVLTQLLIVNDLVPSPS